MKNYICKTCGTQYSESDSLPAHCLICNDERQYVGMNGQQWTTLDDLPSRHRNLIKVEEPNLIGIGAEPSFAIGQRALLIQLPNGNVLWDCLAVIDEEMVKAVKELGGVSAIGISHPHFYSTMVEWSRAFDGAPIHLHAANREWVMRSDPAIRFWEGETLQLQEVITLIRCVGQFPASTAFHVEAGGQGRA